jgi:Kef-type K+ transport system membrane component KefB
VGSSYSAVVDHSHFTILNDIGFSIIAAALAGLVARAAKQPAILGYVLGGVVLGAPLGLGLVSNAESIEIISEIGLIFLLFIIGLEIQLPEIARLGKSTFVVGLAQFFGCLGLGLVLFRPLGAGGGRFDLLYLATCAALSSTLIVVKLLHDKAEIHTAAGRLTVGVLVLQDLFAIVFMALQPSLVEPRVGSIARSLGYGAALVSLSFVASRFVLGPVLRRAAKVPELVLLTSIGWCFAVAGLAQMAGLSREMGALFAGMSIAAFPYGADVTAKLAGIRDFFVTLFFVSLGLKLPLPTLDTLTFSLAVAGLVLITRLVTVVPPAWLLGPGLRTGAVTALNLAQVSEFSLVILGLGVGYGHVTTELQSAVLTAMLLTSVVSTYVITFNDRLARVIVAAARALGSRERAGEKPDAPGHGEARDIVLLGCYREGLALLDRIESELPELKRRILVIDFNPALKARLEGAGFAWAYGDLAHPETLAHLGLEKARVVLSSIPDTFLKGTTNRRLLLQAQQIAPHAHFIMTAEDASGEEDLHALGAQDVLVTGEVAGERLLALVRPLVGPARRRRARPGS